MKAELIPIRVLLPNLKGIATDASSEANMDLIYEAARATYYYFFDNFNVTMLIMNDTVSDLSQSRGKEILISLDNNLADSAFFEFTPTFLPHNVTISGSVTSYRSCSLITFPKMAHKLETQTALHFLQLLFGFSHQIILILFILLINVLWCVREDKSFLTIHWQIAKIASRQPFIAPKTFPIRIAIVFLSIGFTIFQAIVLAHIDTDKISKAYFKKVESFKDVYEQNLLPGFQLMSDCSPSIREQSREIKSHFVEKNLLKGKESLSATSEMILSDTFVRKNLDQIAIVQSSLQWLDTLQKICTLGPWELIRNPPYISKPFEIFLNPLTMSKHFSKKGQDHLKLSVATLYEQGLKDQRGIFLKTSDTNPFCMRSHLEPEYKVHSVIELKYYHSLLIVWMIVLSLATLVFMLENFF
ncbi:uncharacterized protein LOC141853539 [Brevipalpus obovatus]|uniref:uncharacterized protein LOC141853539 n=1 Tax=Brevipalpus obovatus TaxID=246614 RepID=UPI003D9DF6DF